jgi:hypothetical protein
MMKRLLLALVIIMLMTTLISGLIWYYIQPTVEVSLPVIMPVGYY